MNILFIYWGRKGGIPRFFLEFARSIHALETESAYYSYSKQNDLFCEHDFLTPKSFILDTMPSNGGYFSFAVSLLKNLYQLIWWMKSKNISTIMTFSNHYLNPLFYMICRLKGVKVITLIHDASCHPGEQTFYESFLIKSQLFFSTKVVTLSEYVKNQLLKFYPRLLKKPIQALFHPVFFKEHSDTMCTFGNPQKLLFLGRLLPYKGLNLLLETFKLLKETHPDITLTIAGSGTLDTTTLHTIKALGITLHQRWLDDAEIISFIKSTDIVILPYNEASQSGVVAAAHGLLKPVVVTPVGGLIEQLYNNQGGRVAEHMDATSVKNAVVTLLDADASSVHQGLDHIQNHYTFDTFAAELMKAVAR
jgi:glycosyltransferase involved in cell wall biosynthesis